MEIIEKYISPVVFGLTTIAFATFVYVALTQSPKAMKSYSFLLVCQVGISYSYDVLFVLFQPVVLFPYTGFYANGYLDFGQTGTLILVFLFASNVLVLYCILSMQHVYRLAALYTPNKWIYQFAKIKLLFSLCTPLLAMILVGMISRILGPCLRVANGVKS